MWNKKIKFFRKPNETINVKVLKGKNLLTCLLFYEKSVQLRVKSVPTY